MNNKDYLPRLVDAQIKLELSTFGAICIEGPKWCGKTWTSQHHANSAIYLGDPARNFQNKTLALLEPSKVLEGKTPRLIDEWQEVPLIWDAVRYEVDHRGKKGQFILTGSSTPIKKGVLHSGAGRISTIKMRPMSLYESRDSSGLVSLRGLFDDDFRAVMNPPISLETLIKLAIRGGWPGSIGLDYQQYRLIPKEYIKALINHDLYRLEGINRNTNKIHLLLKSLARNEATTVSMATLRQDIRQYDHEEISNETIATYLTILERLFLIEDQKPFSLNIRSGTRIKQASKRHFVDPSLAIALLDATYNDLLNDLHTFGFLFEALCERDLRIYAESIGGELYHYQDYKNREIDAVIALEDGRWGAFEIKLGVDRIDEAARKLIRYKNEFAEEGAKGPSILVIICGLSNYAYLRDDGVYVVPLTALKP